MKMLASLYRCTAREGGRFIADQRGATSIEYAMIASGVGAAVAAMVYNLGSSVKNFFTNLTGLMG